MRALFPQQNKPGLGLLLTRFSVFPKRPKPSHGDRGFGALGLQMRGLSRRTLAFALTVLPLLALINVGVLVWSLGSIDLSTRIVAPGLLVLAVFVVFIPMIANSLRLAIWSRFLGLKLGMAGSLRVITGTMIANSLTPPAITGMPIRFMFLMNEGADPQRAMSLISFQTAEDMLILSGLVGICIGLSGFALHDFFASQPELIAQVDSFLQIAGKIAAFAALGLIAVTLFLKRRFVGGSRLKTVNRARRRLRAWAGSIGHNWRCVAREGKGLALLTLGLTGLQWGARFSIAGLVLAAFGTEWRPALHWLLQYLVQAMSSIVPTPGGAGGAEAAFLLLFALFVDGDVLVPAMSTWRLMYFYLPLAGAALLFFFLRSAMRGRCGESLTATASSKHVPAE